MLPAKKFLGLDDFKDGRRDELAQGFVAGVDFGQHLAGIDLQGVGVVVGDVLDEFIFHQVRVEVA